MTLQELFRMFSGAADGQRMTNEPVGSMNNLSQGILNQPTQQTFTPSPQAAPEPQPQVTPAPVVDPRVSPQLPIESMNGSSPGPVASVMAGQDQPSQYTPPDLSMGPQQGSQGALNMPQYEQGILSQAGGYLNKAFGLDQPDLISRIGYGLGVAGSQDPFKALMMLKEQQSNEAKQKAEQAQKNKPKFTPIAGGALVMAEIPGQAPQILPLADVQEWMLKLDSAKANTSFSRQVAVAGAVDDLKTKKAADDAVVKNAPDISDGIAGVTSLRRLAGQLGSVDPKTGQFVKADDNLTGPLIGLASKIPVVGPALLQKSIDLQESVQQEIVKTLRATLGAQYTQKEGEDFARRGYNPNLDEKANFDRINQRANDLEFMLQNKADMVNWYKSKGTLDGFVESLTAKQPANATGSAAPTSGTARPPLAVPGLSQRTLDLYR